MMSSSSANFLPQSHQSNGEDNGAPAISPEYISDLTAAARDALNSPNREVRDAASDRLLFLSSFDHWESTTKRLLPYCADNCLRFIVCKAMYFMVANELGPQERAEMKLYVLRYCKDRRQAGEALPVYVQRELYLVYATALFSNWKIAVISDVNSGGSGYGGDGSHGRHGHAQANGLADDGPATPTAFELAAQIVDELNAFLTPEQTLDCLREVISYYFIHISKVAIPSLRSAFVNSILPYFFETGAHGLSVAPHKAAEVCCAALESLSPLTNGSGLLTVKYTSEPSIHILRWADGWSNSLTIAMECAGSYLCAYPTGPLAQLMGRLVQLCSRVDSPHEDFMRSGRGRLANSLLNISAELLLLCQRDSTCIPDSLVLASSLLVSTFERHEEAAVTHLAQNFPAALLPWTDAAQYVLGRFAEDEDDLRQGLMHLFYLIADRLLPRPTRRRTTTGEELSLDRPFYGAIPPMPEKQQQGTSPLSSDEPDGILGRENNRQLSQLIESVFTAYLSAVIDKAHLREDSDELRFEAGVSLHNERTLYPLAEMLHCDKMNFLPMMMARLQAAIDDFQVCAGARESSLRGGGASGALTDATVQRLTQMLSSVDTSQVQCLFFHQDSGNGGMFTNFHQSPLSLFLTRVCLSRLSVLISIFAIAIMRNAHDTSDEVLLVIGGFARKLLTEDDSLTNEMLQTLNLFDFSMDDDKQADGSGGPPMRRGAGGAASSVQGGGVKPSLHIGILRSLFFFCNCVYESNFDRRLEFVEIILDLLRFVYLYHSDEAALVVDANVLFKRVVTEGPTTGYMLSSDKLGSLIQAVEEDAIPALRLPSPVNPPLPPAARNGFFTAFTAFVETRFYAGFPVGNVVSVMFTRALSVSQRLQPFTIPSLEEVVAITNGITQPDTLLVALDAAMVNRGILIDHVMRTDAVAAAHVISWLSALCRLSRTLLQEDAASTTQWDWASLLLNSMTTYFSLLSTRAPGETPKLVYMNPPFGAQGDVPHRGGSTATKFYEFHVDAVDAEVIYDLADVLYTLCTASWCNLGVLDFYERDTVERFFCGVVQLLTSVSPPLLMSSDRGKKVVFDAMITALAAEGHVFTRLHLLLMRQRVWQQVLDHLTRCLQYDYLPEIVQAMLLIVRHDERARSTIPDYVGIGDRQTAAAFHEVAVLIAVAPFLEIRQLSYAFDILRVCYALAKEPCTERLKALLGFCSAYHRVRLRTMWSMLMNGEPDMLDRYVSVFGQSSKVAVLSAW